MARSEPSPDRPPIPEEMVEVGSRMAVDFNAHPEHPLTWEDLSEEISEPFGMSRAATRRTVVAILDASLAAAPPSFLAAVLVERLGGEEKVVERICLRLHVGAEPWRSSGSTHRAATRQKVLVMLTALRSLSAPEEESRDV